MGVEHFNPRAPYGARPKQEFDPWRDELFQSTRPLRGATLMVPVSLWTMSISIHAPLTGRDSSAYFFE